MYHKDQWIAEHERILNEATELTFEQFAEQCKELGLDREEAWKLWKQERR